MQRLNGKKRVLVTGGAKHLGRQICLDLAKNNYDLVIHYYKSVKEAEELALSCREYGVDVQTIYGCFDSIETLTIFAQNYRQQFSETYALINNVGNYLVKSGVNTSFQEWLNLFQNNLNAPFFLIQALLPELIKSQGAVINIGAAGLNRSAANTYSTAYTIAKHSLLLLTKSLAKELAPLFVKVNMISPGHLESSVDLHDVKDLPMKRPARTEEVAHLILELLSPKSAYITGQNIEVAGGFSL